MEHYTDYSAFCRTDSYQQWLTGWTPPSGLGVDVWRDSQTATWDYSLPRESRLKRWTTRIPFYLLDSLEIGDLPCVDIGCAHNWFQQSYPTIWGVDPHSEPHRDEQWTPEWYRSNQGRWDRAFSCCAIHFCDQADISWQVAKVRGILKPGGRACIAINRAPIEYHTQKNYSEAVLQEYLEATPGMTRMVWVDSPRNASLDGNVFLWIDAG